MTPLHTFVQLSSILIWLGLTAIWFYAFVTFPYQCWLAIFAIVFFASAQYLCGGAEVLMVHHASKWYHQRGDGHHLKNGSEKNGLAKID